MVNWWIVNLMTPTLSIGLNLKPLHGNGDASIRVEKKFLAFTPTPTPTQAWPFICESLKPLHPRLLCAKTGEIGRCFGRSQNCTDRRTTRTIGDQKLIKLRRTTEYTNYLYCRAGAIKSSFDLVRLQLGFFSRIDSVYTNYLQSRAETVKGSTSLFWWVFFRIDSVYTREKFSWKEKNK